MGPRADSGRNFARRWIVASTLGWLAGFAFVIALAFAAELVSGGLQVIVGLGMGFGVGLLQGRLLRPWLGSPWPWTRATAVGMTLPFLAQDLLRATGVAVPVHLWIYVPVGGVLVGLLQARVLGRVSSFPGRWVLPAAVGWSLPALLIGLGDATRDLGGWSTLLSMGGMVLGGTLLGMVTAAPLRALLDPDRGQGGAGPAGE